MDITELLVKKGAFNETQIATRPIPDLLAGEALFRIDKFALTANNITYAVTGDALGYWKFFPADEPWGKVPVWGFANAVASNCDAIPVGERLYGFFPIASHVVLQPGKVSDSSLVDIAAHRQALPPLYNQYRRTNNDPAEVKAREDDRCLFFPLFATSFILYDYLLDNNWVDVEQVVIVSASSKTAFGLANMVARHQGPHPRSIGLTSPKNVEFVKSLGTYDEVAPYDDIAKLDASRPTAIIDMAGSDKLTAALHHHFRENVKLSSAVGATHWGDKRSRNELPGAKPTFFFAPAQIAKRASEWGAAEVMRRAFDESMRAAAESRPHIHMVYATGPEAVVREFLRTAKGGVLPNEGLILSL